MDQRGPAWRKWALLRHDMTCARWLHRCAMLRHAAPCTSALQSSAVTLSPKGLQLKSNLTTRIQQAQDLSQDTRNIKKHMMPRCHGATVRMKQHAEKDSVLTVLSRVQGSVRRSRFHRHSQRRRPSPRCSMAHECSANSAYSMQMKFQ